ncbi:Dolichyl-phosphate-mannose-protein mannosyltransferase [Tritrichomonas foetus]|uniref:Dolichyl-phosphate-mannose-protein mannosyltransferase n=1 Tax=Tritrichomonas foetus TaxID=1144522 RepID=A0A1J4K017_9EUKA|nr:Dolichyl-phosphate-mannose-protein mannosyltransferase [Tritrichomonas foetus]|eukprot:OHT03124.1 Dolichyl-phosphate-mannose-protein mannosyltransferase [Tritrichomonas foetus]
MDEAKLPLALTKPRKKFNLNALLVPPRVSINFGFHTEDVILVIVLIFFGVLTRVFRIQFPRNVVPGEELLGCSINNFINGEYFNPKTPPLAAVFYSYIASSSGYKGDFNFTVGSKYPSMIYVQFRTISAILSGFCVPLVYLITRSVLSSRFAALTAGIIAACDISLIEQGRFFFIDGLFQFLSCLSIFLVFLDENISSLFSLILKCVGIGITFSVSYRSAPIIIVAIAREYMFFKQRGIFSRGPAFIRSSCLILIVFLIHILSYLLHISFLPYIPDQKLNETEKNTFQEIPSIIAKSLVDKNNPIWSLRYTSIFTKLFQCFTLMFKKFENEEDDLQANGLIKYETGFWSWPLALRKWVLYYEDTNRHYACMANLFIYVPVFCGVIIAFCYLGMNGLKFTNYYGILLIGFAFSYFPYIFVKHTFLYHYMVSLIFGIVLLVVVIDRLAKPIIKSYLFCLISAMSIFGYFLWAPFAYGLETKDLPFLIRNVKWT